jgi:hypothetical protein
LTIRGAATAGLEAGRHLSADQLRAAAEEARTAERTRGQISTPDAGDGDLAQATKSAARLVRLSRILERLADELACGRAGLAYSLLVDGNGLIGQGRWPWVFDNQRLLLLDGTANLDILRQFVPRLQDRPEIRVQRKARVIQSGIAPSSATVWLSGRQPMARVRPGSPKRASQRSPSSLREWPERDAPRW